MYTHTNTENEEEHELKKLKTEIEELKQSNNEKINLLAKVHMKEMDELKKRTTIWNKKNVQ